ncbi:MULTISPECIES: hypothetical protein [unclassified Hahella]|uniref:hypothetical protein n=1 Tax=unclassified Hahella TaxID=2624107 RepID=UPI001C1F1D61|nr:MULTISPECIES: hypothetical protein [unclassified Hahella]MBU6950227.1 hypothetical protein [Hahella sp. HN01]MDG9666440.1 hypothetical protein [Hahella sp. CR1]
MTPAKISDACTEFLSLIEVLDDAYWEASTITNKDTIYDVLSVFQQEAAELNKLSIQDHHYPYEMITEGIRQVSPKLHRLQASVSQVVERTQTQVRLRQLLKNVMLIIEQQANRWSSHE